MGNVEDFNEWVRNEIAELKVRMAVHTQRIETLERSIENIEKNTTWTVRLIIGAIILALIGFVTKGGLQ